ncbi:hypothetical protein [Tenacibaculum maritimum]|uniref:hypothetical protein n=1 Tax=Tenacibaculum maritimum TaxID=107401 RepID=UPI00387651A3
MKIKIYSTETEPLNFFKWFFNSEMIAKYYDWFFGDKNTEHEPRLNPSQKSNRLDGYIEYLCPNNNFELVKVTIEESLDKYLSVQSSSTIKLITNNVNELIKDSKEYKNQLEFYIKELDDLEDSQKELIQQYPFLVKPIIDIQNYINKRYLKGSIREYNIVANKNEKLIYEIFGYLGGVNDNGNKVLNNNDYDYLIQSLKSFISTGEVPIFKKKIPKLNGVCNLTLRRTFYMFWKKIGDKEKYPRDKIVKFLKLAFEQVKETSEKTLYDGLTKKPPEWNDFIPKIVKELP